MDDLWSCQLQGGDYFVPTGSCDGRAPLCSGLVTRDYCIQFMGCGWREPDGSVTTNPFEGGTCRGEIVPCRSLLDMEDCRQTPNCEVVTRENALEVEVERCDGRFSTSAIDTTDCVGLAERTSLLIIHPDVAHRLCVARFGCEWVAANGAVEAARGGAPRRAVRACDHPAGAYQLRRTPGSRNNPGCAAASSMLAATGSRGKLANRSVVNPSVDVDRISDGASWSRTRWPTPGQAPSQGSDTIRPRCSSPRAETRSGR